MYKIYNQAAQINKISQAQIKLKSKFAHILFCLFQNHVYRTSKMQIVWLSK